MKRKKLGDPAFANQLFMVSDGISPGQVFEDPADAIAEAEELAESEGADWHVFALDVDDTEVHVARARKRRSRK